MWFYQPIPQASLILSSTRAISVSDSLSAGSTDTTSLLISVLTQDSVSGFDDDWRLLTDSSTFTYHNRTDSLATRLNGAITTSTEQSVNGTDSLAVTITEAVSISSSVSASDSVSCVASDNSLTVSSSVSASDSLLSGITDSFTGSQSFSTTDSSSVGLSDASSSLLLTVCSDSISSGLSEVITQVSAVLSATDSLAVQCTDTVEPVSVSAAASDSLKAGLTDTFTGGQAFSIQDSVAIQTSETLANSSSVSTSDSLAILLSDVGSLSQVTISASDSLSAVLSEVVNVVQNTLLSVSENLVTGFSESATIINAIGVSDALAASFIDTFTGSQALGVSDTLGLQLSEDQSSSLLMAASDGVATSVFGAASVYLEYVLTDSWTAGLSDVGSKQDAESAIPKSAYDSCGLALEEGAVTELAGPYWTGTIGEDHGLVYADSYGMGRRENPGRMRW